MLALPLFLVAVFGLVSGEFFFFSLKIRLLAAALLPKDYSGEYAPSLTTNDEAKKAKREEEQLGQQEGPFNVIHPKLLTLENVVLIQPPEPQIAPIFLDVAAPSGQVAEVSAPNGAVDLPAPRGLVDDPKKQ